MKGARLIIYNAIRVILGEGNAPSIRILAERTGYSERTVKRTLAYLRQNGYIHYTQPAPGKLATYTLGEN